MSRAWVHRVMQRRRETGSIAPRKQTKFRGRVLAGQEARLAALITAQPDATLAELREALRISAALSTLLREIDRLPLTVKKTAHADEPRRPEVAAARRQWQTWQPLRDVRQYVFLDECGVTTELLRRYGRRPRGVRLQDHTPCGHWQTHTVVAALRLEGWAHRRSSTDRSTRRRSSPISNRSSCPRYDPATSSCSTIWPSTNHRRSLRRSTPSARRSDSFRPTVPTSIRSNSPLPK